MNDFQHRLQRALDADFLIERELGGAGMSRVFVATERALQRRVVVKVLPPELAAGINVERFRREIQLAAQLQHPHIVPLLSAGDDDGLLWFSMPYIEGESLRGTLDAVQRLPPRDVVRILHDVVDALAYAHELGIVHRDIKPDNILTSGMHALVSDFGVAKALSLAIPVHGSTTTGMAIGTPAYMAPEQLAADPAADHRVDIYGVGLVAYELLTGRSPFTGASPQATLAAQLTQMPAAPHLSVTDIPQSLSTLIMRCLEKDADKRPATARALLAALEALPPMSSATARTVAVARRPVVARAAVLAGGIVVAVASYVVLQGTQGSRRDSAAASGDSMPDARDAGPGGDRARTMSVVPPESAATHVDTVYRDLSDRASSVPVAVVISHAESLAIAAAVSARQLRSDAVRRSAAPTATQTPGAAVPAISASPGEAQVRIRSANGTATTVDREQLLAEVGRIFADSMARALLQMDSAMRRLPQIARIDVPRAPTTLTPMLAPSTDGRVRVVVTPYANATGKREYAATTRAVARDVRAALPSDRYDVVTDTLTERAMRTMPDRMSVGWGLRADYVVTGMVSTRGDSVVVLTTFTDVRSGRFSRMSESMAPASNPTLAFPLAARQVNAWLDTAKVNRVRRPRGMQPD
ncbi:MAG: serine/threonine-protein kinase [Gemmatimonadota bacterium]|nr:serine/threonine-protein kinase [Gemmatimonadota bacterium]